VAVAELPVAVSVAVPSEMAPVVKKTEPVGVTGLPAAVTVTVRRVLEFRPKLAGSAVTEVVEFIG